VLLPESSRTGIRDPGGKCSLSEKLAFLSDAASFPDPTTTVIARETHMSWVFLTDRRVYKMKKPVSYPFLDFSSLAKRRHFCAEELRLNRRLAERTYISLVALRRDRSGALTLTRPGRVVEWLVEMERLPQAHMLDTVISRGGATESDFVRIAERLAAFYRGCRPERIPVRRHWQHFETELAISRSVLERSDLGVCQLAFPLLARLDRALVSMRPELEARVRLGRIVEGHGDLRPEHVCLVEPLQIIDCLEFNRSMRLVDPFDEVNYLGLECEMLSAPWARPILIRVLAQDLGGAPSPALVTLYGVLRLVLRARLCLAHLLQTPVRHPDKWRPLATGYLTLADRDLSALESDEI
jgi:aminoglycoside phosphotransferase family enzyme